MSSNWEEALNKLGKNPIDSFIVNSGNTNDIWGRVIDVEPTCFRLDNGRIAKKDTHGKKWLWAGESSKDSQQDEKPKVIYVDWRTEGGGRDGEEHEGKIYIICVHDTMYTDAETRVIFATTQEQAIELWHKASPGIEEWYKKKNYPVYCYEIGAGNVSDVFSISTG